MADSSKQSFLNSLFQWTVKNTAAEEASAAAAATTTDPAAGKKPNVPTNQTLTLNDLTHVLGEYGINVKKTFYYYPSD